jgi:vacuolar-type H+-ATPase subunit D/Vma8
MAELSLAGSTEAAPQSSQHAEALLQRLDDLMEQYLHTLDRYQKAREALSKNLASGYLSLAQANFANNKGRRYGQDYYDERMQAQRGIQVSSSGEQEQALEFECVKATALESSENTKESSDEEQAKSPPRDPLRWFGVLVPSPLRSAQTSFVSAVETSIPDLLNVQQELRTLEIEIGRTRKSLKKLGKV